MHKIIPVTGKFKTNLRASKDNEDMDFEIYRSQNSKLEKKVDEPTKTSKHHRHVCSRLRKKLQNNNGRFDTAYELLQNIRNGRFDVRSEEEIYKMEENKKKLALIEKQKTEIDAI